MFVMDRLYTLEFTEEEILYIENALKLYREEIASAFGAAPYEIEEIDKAVRLIAGKQRVEGISRNDLATVCNALKWYIESPEDADFNGLVPQLSELDRWYAKSLDATLRTLVG